MSSVARPTDQETRPMILATVETEGGSETRVDLSLVLLALNFDDEESKADKLSLSVDNFDGSAFDTEIFAKGNIIRWQWGFPGFLSPKREAVITKTTGGITLTVEAKSTSILMGRRSVMETYDNVTRSEVVEIIAERNGFGQARRRVTATTQIFESLIQPNVSDARMLTNLAHKQGFEFYVDHNGLYWGPRGFDKAPTRQFVWYGRGLTRNRDAIIDYTVDNDLTAKPAKTTLKGLNPDTKQQIEAVGSNAETARPVLQTVVEIRDFETGTWKQELRSASEEIKPTTETTEEAAKERADGRFRKISQTAVKLSLEIIGDPLLVAKTTCVVDGIAKRINGRYYVKKVTTTVDSSGARQRISLITDGSGGTHGVSLNDALFATTTGSGDPFGASVTAIAVINDAILKLLENSSEVQAAGIDITGLTGRLEALDSRLSANPQDTAAYQELASIGGHMKKTGFKGVGKSLSTAGKRGESAAANAATKGTLNTKPVVEDDRELEGFEVENSDGEAEIGWRGNE